MSVSGWCFFWYRLTRDVPDKFHRAVKWLCVVCVKWRMPDWEVDQRRLGQSCAKRLSGTQTVLMVPAHPSSPRQNPAVKRLCMCMHGTHARACARMCNCVGDLWRCAVCHGYSKVNWVNGAIAVFATSFTTMGIHVPYGIIQCYVLPAEVMDIPAFTPAN